MGIPRTHATSAALAVCGLLLLTSCGSDDSSDGKDIDGAEKASDSGPPSESSSPSATKDANAPKFDFPKRMKVVIDNEDTGDGRKGEVLRDHGYATKAMVLSFAKADPELPVAYKYRQDGASEVLQYGVKRFQREGLVSTGTIRYYKHEVTMKGKRGAVVRFCESQRDTFDKVAKSGKVLRTKPSAKDFTKVRDIMQKRGNAWRVVSTASERGAQECAQ